jgi:hypothetical protein
VVLRIRSTDPHFGASAGLAGFERPQRTTAFLVADGV